MIATDVGPHKHTGAAAEAAGPRLEAVMGKAIPAQHPAVVLRSHFNLLRALLATAMIAVLGLTVAVVILATDDDADTGVGTATQLSAPGPTASVRYDGGPEEGMAALAQRSGPAAFNLNSTGSQPGVRYDGGPEEGASGALSSGAASSAAPGIRYDGGPEEGSAGAGH